MSFENWQPETILALIVGLGIYFSAVSAVYINFGPPAKRKAILKKKQEEQLKKQKEDSTPGHDPKHEESVQEILDNLKKEKDRSLGNIRNLDEDIRRHEERLRQLEEEKRNGE